MSIVVNTVNGIKQTQYGKLSNNIKQSSIKERLSMLVKYRCVGCPNGLPEYVRWFQYGSQDKSTHRGPCFILSELRLFSMGTWLI